MNRSGPLVVVCLAPTDLRPEIDDLTGTVRSDPRRADLPAAEVAALEHGLRVAEAWDGRVLAVTAGPAQTDIVLHGVAALGAEVLRVDRAAVGAAGPGPQPVAAGELAGDSAELAIALAAAIRLRGTPALVICGDRSAGHGVGAVPALLAHELGLDQALGLVSLSVEGPGRLLAERRLDGGWREKLVIHGPAVLSVEAAGVRLRRAGLAAALDVEPQPVPSEPAGRGPVSRLDVTVGAARPYRPRTRPVPAPEGDAHHRLLALTGALSTREPARVVGPLGAAEAADHLLTYLERFGFTAG